MTNLKTAKPRILFLTRWYPNRFDPMPGLFIQRHAGIAAEFADVAVIYLHKVAEDAAFTGLKSELKEVNGVFELIVYYQGDRHGQLFQKLNTLVYFFKAWRTALKILKKQWGLPEIVHVHILTRMGAPALWLRWRLGCPYVITEHWTRYLPDIKGYKGMIRKLLTRIIVKNASALSTVSCEMVRAMQCWGLKNRNTLVIPNCVDTGRYKPSGEQKITKQILHVSCFTDQSKNISGILRVIQSLSVYRNDFILLLVGDGMDALSLKQQSDSYGLTDSIVTFSGLLQGEELINAYRQSSFLLLFSNKENMPVVISEAFSCGIPVVSSHVGGISEHVFGWNGRLVEKGDETALEKSLNFMLDHYTEFDSARIREYAIANFSEEVVSRKLRELYHFTGRITD